MRNKVAGAFVAILATLAFGGVAFAAHGAATIKGEVISVDPTAMILVMKPQGEKMLLTFRVEGQAARALANLKRGDKVEVSTHSFTVGGPQEGEHEWEPTAVVVTKSK
ncbi:MAG: hypothetical protein FIA90_09745 [candidate division NC10 bacterium]|nr:hypothetical protein [Candidatus Methylomirabilis sp.]NJD68912.1 hypothetical protein [candidate division NC10 bacterium]